jgi:hypothetical protein
MREHMRSIAYFAGMLEMSPWLTMLLPSATKPGIRDLIQRRFADAFMKNTFRPPRPGREAAGCAANRTPAARDAESLAPAPS